MVNVIKPPSANVHAAFGDQEKVRVLMDTVCMEADGRWYVVAADWFNKWSDYMQSVGSDGSAARPGPIDNDAILSKDKPGDLAEGLIEKEDYHLIPEEAWRILFLTYGLKDNQQPIERRVVRLSSSTEDKSIVVVEIYPLILAFQLCNDSDSVHEVPFSQGNSFYELECTVREMFKLEGAWHLYVKIEGNKYSQLNPKNKSTQLHELGLISHQTIFVDVPANGEWHIQADGLDRRSISDFGASSSKAIVPCYARGLCGLNNLGNTCFMNSAIQCLSNVPPLTNFFLSGKYKADLNYNNPLGSRGEIVTAYVDLINCMWSGRSNSFVPSKLRYTIGRFQPMFCGFQQHDAQELMAFLLDALHEDLNRVVDKPYIEAKEVDNVPDDILAERTWTYHKMRNDSIMTDLFVGLLKSTVVCPDCSKVSVKFDPYGSLSLPLPEKLDKQLPVFFVPLDVKEPVVQHSVGLKKSYTVKDAIKSLSSLVNVVPNRIIFGEMDNGRMVLKQINETFTQYFSSRDRSQSKWVAYEVEYPVGSKDGQTVCVLQSHFEYGDWNLATDYRTVPQVLRLYKDTKIESRIQKAARSTLRRFVEPKFHSIYRNAWTDPKNGNLHASSDEGYNEEENGTGGMQVPFVLVASTHTGRFLDGPIVVPEKCDVLYVAAKWSPSFEMCLVKELPGFEHSFEETGRRPSRYSRIIELADCLDLFTTTEKLSEQDAWYCPTCKRHQQATKKFDIWSLPEVLVVHLKRFSNDRIYRTKIESLVNFAVKNLAMSKWVINRKYANYRYDLVAVCNHDGVLADGHYYAYGLNCLKNKWYNFNDSCVSEISEADIVSKSAYVLVYMRQNSKLSLSITVGTDSEDGMSE